MPTLRELLAAYVQSATITERVGGARNGKTSWVRAEVAWTPEVALLLEHGFLTLEPAEEAQVVPDKAERMRRWRAQRRAARSQMEAILPEGLRTVNEAAQELGVSAIRRGLIAAARLPERPGRTYLTTEEVDRYRTEHLGRRGRPVTPGRAEERPGTQAQDV